jgi:hypothetical protein
MPEELGLEFYKINKELFKKLTALYKSKDWGMSIVKFYEAYTEVILDDIGDIQCLYEDEEDNDE